ncbi:3-hydroxyacyl-CoA dehydrogenase-like protein LAM1 [Penicillium manginii]|uniref:3-hydroxyacyl-CoA dehydrogenase-like protein LAM1 n=1 Tax=Penicillium manginii TaxID=203109 RepID=UPI002546E268|nr:3-hydroxyacyl-CoA dehydrogenase-like protein LAM1 [Penicillium manginii]KAJ5739942.1 3-hydroxyacyl-CoA dehydrogenase-like protein LAM1 [Penicillium manginii]
MFISTISWPRRSTTRYYTSKRQRGIFPDAKDQQRERKHRRRGNRRRDAEGNPNSNHQDRSGILLAPAPFGPCKTFTELEPAVRDVWLAVEVAPEKVELKKYILAALDTKTLSDCILAWNSSSFKSSLMSSKVSSERRKKVLNVHFTMPPSIRTVELMTNGETDPKIVTYLEDVQGECGMLPVTARRETTG